MTERAALMQAVQSAQDGPGVARAVAALDSYDQGRADMHAQDRELDMAARHVTATLTPVPVHEHHTAATDWLMDYEEPRGDYRTAMIAEASAWVQGLDRAVLADREEFTEQARGRARTLASAYGSLAPQASREFLGYVAYLSSTAASGLPQIDQTIDPNNQPSATPYPTEVFDNFAPQQNDYNGGIEGDNHQSQVDSMQAPLLQQVMQQDGSGSGYGSGPAKPVTHTTQMDTSNSYAEVPLGQPGQIPTTPAATDGAQPSMPGASTPNPAAGSDAVADDDQLQDQMDEDPSRKRASWTQPDPAGFRWLAGAPEIREPYHTRCAGLHWPDQRCGRGTEHTASVAIGYNRNYEDLAREQSFERAGAQEGGRALASARGNLLALAKHHNRLVQAYAQGERSEDDAAVLHGFMAVVRPVLAKGKPGGLANGGVTEKERKNAPHHLPGTDKFPIGSAADVENAKHDIGRTDEPKGEVVNYINDEAKQYGVAPVGGGKGKKKSKK